MSTIQQKGKTMLLPEGIIPIDVWLRIPDEGEESDAEANTYITETGFSVEWYLTDVGQVTAVEFDTLADAYDWLQAEGFANYTSA